MKAIIFRLFIVIFAFSFWMAYRLLYYKNAKYKNWNYTHCYNDYILNFVYSNIFIFLSQNLNVRDILIIFGSVSIDMYFIIFLLIFIHKGNSWKPIFHFILFYFTKYAILNPITQLEINQAIIFYNNAFPSIIFNYFRNSNTFYSEYTGLILIIGLQLSNMGYKKLFYFGVFMSVYLGVIQIIMQYCNTIYVIFALIAAHYFYMVSDYIGGSCDKFLNIGNRNNTINKKEENKAIEIIAINIK
jgi:hypothetical protein